ncbi:class F sortase [Streptacidiphilus carbonis]|uniref:class F sortase n=1 Tax=Streptacidiphilus carbonis TaxID=105422 RepID=UPI00126A1634|nr:class F sortase [Streptacidiphilus carbonis]
MAELRRLSAVSRPRVLGALASLSAGLVAVSVAGAALGVGAPVRTAAAVAVSARGTASDSVRPAPRSSASAAPASRAAHAPLARSTPIQLLMPSVGLTAPLLGLGMDSKGQPELPPFSQPRTAGWLRDSATPGEAGTSVLVGHVDTRTGPAVFWNLSAVKPGAPVEVARLDGSTAEFTVDRVQSYPKASFPSAQVYAPAKDAQLRIITCGGGFDRKRAEYTGNVVLFAHLSGVRAA